MLVPLPKENERLIIDGKIAVTVVRASRGTVQLGIEGPPHISVHRDELFCPAGCFAPQTADDQ